MSKGHHAEDICYTDIILAPGNFKAITPVWLFPCSRLSVDNWFCDLLVWYSMLWCHDCTVCPAVPWLHNVSCGANWLHSVSCGVLTAQCVLRCHDCTMSPAVPIACTVCPVVPWTPTANHLMCDSHQPTNYTPLYLLSSGIMFSATWSGRTDWYTALLIHVHIQYNLQILLLLRPVTENFLDHV